MVKRIDLPKFTLATKTYNAYNRKNIVTGAIQYEPITVAFHDDAADVVTKFWNDYFTYYYRDSDYQTELYQVPHKYTNRQRTKWGYTPINRQLIPFLRDIQIFSLHNKRFTEYRLINPMITSWRHGEHDSSQDNGIMTNNMTVNYETVKYRVGTVNPIDVNGFAVLHYDNVESPISTSKTNIYSNAGLLGALGEAGSQDLARPDGQGSGRGVLSNVLSAYNLYKTAKNANFRSLANQTIGQLGVRSINGALFSSTGNYTVPTLAGTIGYGAATSLLNTNNNVGVNPYATAQNATQNAVNIPGSGASVTVGVPSVSQVSQSIVERGVETVTNAGTVASQFLFAGLAPRAPGITIDPATGQPVTGQSRTFIVDNQGNPIPVNFNPNQTTGAFNPSNVGLNLRDTQQITDGNFTTTVRTYTDGTRVGFDSSGNQLYVIPGSSNVDLIEANRQVNRNLNIDTTAGVRYVTDPQTGLVSAIGGTSAQVGNTITQGVAGVTGIIAGTKVFEALNKTALGKTVIGQVFSASVSAGLAQGVFKFTNNLISPLINSATGQIGAAWNSAVNSVQIATGQQVGNGGFQPGQSSVNRVSQVQSINNTTVETYKNGDVYQVNADGSRVLIDNVGPANQQTYVTPTNPTNAVQVDNNANQSVDSWSEFSDYNPEPVTLNEFNPDVYRFDAGT